LALVVQIAVEEVMQILLVLAVELQHFLLLLQLAAVRVRVITLQAAEEILPTVQEELALPVAPAVVQARNRSHIQAAALLLVFLKAALAQLLTELLTEQAALVALQIQIRLASRA
jgi:hypothetical protein